MRGGPSLLAGGGGGGGVFGVEVVEASLSLLLWSVLPAVSGLAFSVGFHRMNLAMGLMVEVVGGGW